MLIKSNFFSSLRWKIVLSYFLIIIISFYVISITTSRILETRFLNERVASLKKNANIIASVTASYVRNKELKDLNDVIKEFSEDIKGRVLILDERAVVISDAYNQIELASRRLNNLEVSEALKGNSVASPYFTPADGWIMYCAAPIFHESQVIGIAFISVSINYIYDNISDIKRKMNLYSIIISILVALFSLYISGYITKPINQMTSVIRKMGQGNLNQRVKVYGKSEISELGKAFNNMSEKLQNTDIARQEFVANASHELKTPLSSIKVLVQSLLHQKGANIEIYEEFLNDIDSEIDRLTIIINDLLNIVEIDKGKSQLNIQEIDINKILSKTIKSLEPISAMKDIELEFIAGDTSIIEGDSAKIHEVFINLIDNAIKYTFDKGKVSIKVSDNNNYVVVEVTDTGIGISEEDIKHIFDRFYRVDKARARSTGGTGLGLSIAHSIVLLHNGNIHAESVLDIGTTFTVELPKKIESL